MDGQPFFPDIQAADDERLIGCLACLSPFENQASVLDNSDFLFQRDRLLRWTRYLYPPWSLTGGALDALQLREELGEEDVYTVLDITFHIAWSLLNFANGWSDKIELEFLSGKVRLLIPCLVRDLGISEQQKLLSL